MSQSQIQEQLQQLKQGQAFSHQQLLQASLVELPITQLVDRITTEMNDNPALETASPGDEEENNLETLESLGKLEKLVSLGKTRKKSMR